MKKRIAVCGGEKANEEERMLARKCGRLIAEKGGILVCGGLGGVMEAASYGAKEAGGLVVGILPGNSSEMANPYVDIPVVTNMGVARNAIIVLSSSGVIAIGGESGTLSEVAFSIKMGVPVVILHNWSELRTRFPDLWYARSPEEAVEKVWTLSDKIEEERQF